jgi:hypothetical protein
LTTCKKPMLLAALIPYHWTLETLSFHAWVLCLVQMLCRPFLRWLLRFVYNGKKGYMNI